MMMGIATTTGKPTNHVVYGEDIAVLAGDGLLSYAFEYIARYTKPSDVPAERILDVIARAGKCVGALGLVGGQVVDIQVLRVFASLIMSYIRQIYLSLARSLLFSGIRTLLASSWPPDRCVLCNAHVREHTLVCVHVIYCNSYVACLRSRRARRT